MSICHSKITKKSDAEKETRIVLDDNKEMVATRKDGKVTYVGNEGWTETDKINGIPLPKGLPKDTIILTHDSPGCGYYWDGYHWIYR